MATTTKTWSWASSLESWADGGNSADIAITHDASNGNPSGSLSWRIAGRNKTGTEWATISGTWAALFGISTGCTVTQVRVYGLDTKCIEWETVSKPPDEARYSDSSGSNQNAVQYVGTSNLELWAGRAVTGTEGSWTSVGPLTNQSVPAGDQSADTTVTFRLNGYGDLNNDASAAVTLLFDNLVIEITYTEPSGDMDGDATITLSASGTMYGDGELDGDSSITISPSGTLYGDGELDGDSSITVSPSGTLYGDGELDGDSSITISPSGTLYGDGELIGDCTVSLALSGTLEQPSGDMEGSVTVSLSGSGTLYGDGELDGDSSITISSSGTLYGDGELAGDSSITISSSGTLYGDGELVGDCTVSLALSGTLEQPAGETSGSAYISVSLSGTMYGDGELAGDSSISVSPSGTLYGDGELIGDSSITVSLSGTLYGDGELDGDSSITITPSATLYGDGELAGDSSITVSPSGTLYGDGELAGDSSITFFLYGIMEGEEPDPPPPPPPPGGGIIQAIRRKVQPGLRTGLCGLFLFDDAFGLGVNDYKFDHYGVQLTSANRPVLKPMSLHDHTFIDFSLSTAYWYNMQYTRDIGSLSELTVILFMKDPKGNTWMDQMFIAFNNPTWTSWMNFGVGYPWLGNDAMTYHDSITGRLISNSGDIGFTGATYRSLGYTIKGTSLKFYRDAILKATRTIGSLPTGLTEGYIGRAKRSGDGNTYQCNGSLAAIAIFDYAMVESDLKDFLTPNDFYKLQKNFLLSGEPPASSVTETLTLSDSATVYDQNVSATDTLVLTDDNTWRDLGRYEQFEMIQLTDVPVINSPIFVEAEDTLVLTDSTDFRAAWSISALDTLTLTDGAWYFPVQVISIDTLQLTETIDLSYPIYASVTEDLGTLVYEWVRSDPLTGEVEFGPILSGLHDVAIAWNAGQVIYEVTEKLTLSDEIYHEGQHWSATDTLTLTDETWHGEIGEVTEYLYLWDKADYYICRGLSEWLTLTDTATFGIDASRDVTETLTLTDAIGEYHDVQCIDHIYHPFIGYSGQQQGYHQVSPTEPSNELRDIIEFFEPWDASEPFFTMPAPEFGDQLQLTVARILQETMGGDRKVIRNKDWKSKIILTFTFSGLDQITADRYQHFLNSTLGREIGLKDHHGLMWRGIIVTPNAQITQRGRDDLQAILEMTAFRE